MNHNTINKAADRFLGWPLPANFSPDCYISFDKQKAAVFRSWPVGTNLLSADQARAMLEYVLQPGIDAAYSVTAQRIYEAYASYGPLFTGAPVAWDHLGQELQAAWIAAAKAI